MLGGLLAALRPLLAVVIVGGAATVMVAPALDLASQRAESRAASSGAAPLRNENPQATPQPTGETDPTKPDFAALLRACLDSRDPDSDECAAAALASGMSYPDFRAKIVAKLEPAPTQKAEPQKTGFDTLLKHCLETRDENSDACIRAGEASGLSAADWSAKIRGKLAAQERTEFDLLFKKCLESRDPASEVCSRAQQLSGMSPEDFDAKVRSKIEAAAGSEFALYFQKCLDTHDLSSEKCGRARELSGLSADEFRAKFESKLGASTKPSTSTFDTLLKQCGETHEKNSDPCLRALVMSGLQPNEFWAKVGAKFGAFH